MVSYCDVCVTARRSRRVEPRRRRFIGARDRATVVLQLMKAASALSDEEGLSGRAAALRELQSLAVHYLERC